MTAYTPDLCHCGDIVAVAAKPREYRDLGPATRALCEECLPARCDAYPGECGR